MDNAIVGSLDDAAGLAVLSHTEAKVRVLVVSDVSLECVHGGAERMLHHHVRALLEADMEVTVLTRQAHTDAKTVFKLSNGVVEHRLTFSGDKGWQGLLELRREAKVWWQMHPHYDVIVAEQPFVMWALLQAGCDLPRLQVCHSFAFEEYATRHGLSGGLPHRLITTAMRRLEGSLYRSANACLVLSEFMKQRMQSFFKVDGALIKLAPGGVSAFDMPWQQRDEMRKNQWGEQAHKPVIVTLRNLVPRTGVDLLLQAAAIVHVDRADVRWKIIGDGSLMQPLKDLRKVLAMDEVVDFLGFLDEKDVQQHLWLADAFMLPTRALEGFGLVTLEANAYGLPVLATPVGANVDVVAWHDLNQLSADISPEALAKIVLSYLDNMPNLKQRQSLAANTLEHFAWQKHDSIFLDALGKCR